MHPPLSIASETAADGSAHNNMPPWVTVAMIVKIKGANIDSAGALVGPPGPGVAIGGTPGQILSKQSGTDYDTAWTTPAQGGHTIQDEGAALTMRAGLNFIGSGVTAADDAANNRTNVTISGGGGAGAPEVYVGPDPPTPRDQQVIWIDTDEAPANTLNTILDVWHQVGASGEPQFQNGWVNYGSGFSGISFRKFPDGKVRLKGVMKSGTIGSAVCFTLPPGYRPPAPTNFAVASAGAFGRFEVDPDGTCYAITGSNVTFFVDGVEFDTETVSQVSSVAAQPIDAWHLVGGTGEPAFQNSWTNFGGTEEVAGFRKDPFGRVHLKGLITGPAFNTAFTLPAGYRPVRTQRFSTAASGNAAASIVIGTDGAVQMGAGSLTWMSLADIEFDTETLTTYSTGAIIPSAQSMPVTMDSWHSVGASGEPAFTNAWANYGSGFRTLQFRKDPTGRVWLRGFITGGTIGQPVFTLPAGYRPTQTEIQDAQTGGGISQIYVNTDGTVNVTTGTNSWVTLNHISFDTDTTLVTASIAVQPMDGWHVVGGASEPPFQNSWTNFGSGYAVAGFRKDPQGRVYLRGMIKSGSVNAVAFTLPAGYRPPATLYVTASVSISPTVYPCNLYIEPNGQVGIYPGTTGTPSWVSLDGAFFDTEAVSNYATAVVQGVQASPAVVTSLPLSPTDGQECYYLADSANGIVFHLKYRAASSSPYKWEVVGGGTLYSAIATDQPRTAAAGYTDLATVGPSIVLPLAGDYEYDASCNGYNASQATVAFVISSPPGTQAPEDIAMFGNMASGQGISLSVNGKLLAQPAGREVRMQYYIGGSIAGNFRYRKLAIRPVRVG